MHLTHRLIDSFRYRFKDKNIADRRWDDGVPGLLVRVWPTGKKTFAISYRFEGRQRYYSLGTYGVLTLQQARDMARRSLVDVLNGIDPQKVRRLQTYGETVGELIDTYLENYSKSEKKGSYTVEKRNAKKYIKPILGSLKVKAVTRGDLIRMMDKIGIKGGKRVTANRVLALISHMYTWAKARDIIGPEVVNPAVGIERFPEQPRERPVRKDEMPALAAAIEEDKSVVVKVALWLYLLLGMRRSELIKLEKKCLDLAGGRLNVQKTKGGKPLWMPLSPVAIELLKRLPNVDDNPYVFQSPRRRKRRTHFSAAAISNAWDRARKRAGLKDVRLHDLRHTVASWLGDAGVTDLVISRTLNHADPRFTAKRYIHLQTSSIAGALINHSENLMLAATPKPADVGDVITVEASSPDAPASEQALEPQLSTAPRSP